MQELQELQADIRTRTRTLKQIDGQIEAEEAASLPPPSAALLSKKQRALELQIKLTQDKIRQAELQMLTAATPEDKAALQADKAALQADKAALQKKEILAMQMQLQEQQQGTCAACAAWAACASPLERDHIAHQRSSCTL